MPKFSFIIPYRNRDVERVKRCLNSLTNQTHKDYELIFIDYGTPQPLQNQIANLVQQQEQIIYHYLNTEGWLWCKSHALNVGISLATGEYLVVVDIDLIYSPNFIKVFSQKVSPTTISIYQCYYLDKNFKNYENLDFNKIYSFDKSYKTSTGLLIAPLKVIKKINGFDTYFKVWGFEDMDMFKRLQAFGLTVQWIGVDEAATFHQWHEKNNALQAMPQSWLATMREHCEFKPNHFTTHTQIEKLLNLAQRPALKLLKSPKIQVKTQKDETETVIKDDLKLNRFEFSAPVAKSFVKFLAQFTQLSSGNSLQVTQTFEIIKRGENSKLAKIFTAINKIFEKLHISYRTTEIRTFETEVLYFMQIRDFLFYFIHDYESYIDDYYFETDGKERINFVVVKK
jgi:glycosyltransferase involved in cell wall biosynthesis